MNIIWTKVVSMIILGGVSILVGLATIQLRKVLGLNSERRSQKVITSMLLCFGAGVLLATCMLHILVESREGMEETAESLEIEWLAELVLCAGFFLVYLVEELVHMTLRNTPHSEELHRTLSLRKTGEQELKEVTQAPTVPPQSTSPAHGHSHIPGKSDSSLRDFFTVLALSFHAVLEGMAVGLEEDKNDVWALFGAIATHKFVITFCISLELLQAGTSMKVFLSYLFTFSLVTPLGIGVGMMISEFGTGEAQELTVAVLSGLAGGTILYVVMFEVLQREKEKNIPGIFQLAGLILGFVGMTLIIAFGPQEPEHEGEGEGEKAVHHHHHLVNSVNSNVLAVKMA